jgi:hypothetical protein
MTFEISFRKSMVWLVLLALLAPSMALARAVCCEPGMIPGIKKEACCPPSMKMPGMGPSRVGAMDGAAIISGPCVVAPATQCAPAPGGEISEFLVRDEGTFEGKLLLTRDRHLDSYRNQDAQIDSSEAPHSLVIERTHPGFFLSHPLFTVLRI